MQEPAIANLEEDARVKPSKPQFDIIVSRQQVNLFLAGQGSGKTFVAGIVSGNMIDRFPEVHGFIGANTYIQLSDSTLFRIRNVWKEYFGWTEWTKENPKGVFVVDVQPPKHFNTEKHEYDTYHGKICFKWGTVIYKGSLDNYKAHDGKEFGWAILDETKDTKEVAVKEVITGRLREPGMYIDSNGELVDQQEYKAQREKEEREQLTAEEFKSFNPLYIFTSPAKVQWLNEWFNLDEYATEITQSIYQQDSYFLKDFANKRVTISSVYLNAENLPSNYISNQLLNLNSSQQDMLIYGNPFSNTGGEFYKCFNRAKNVIDVKKLKVNTAKPGEPDVWECIFNDEMRKRAYCPALPLHISFDFNVNPYMTCTIYQIYGKITVQIDEICLVNPRNTTTDICKEFERKYSDHVAGLFVYGDPAGRAEDTRQEKGHNDFTIIARALAKFKPNLRIMTAAPPVAMRGNFINTIFEKGYDGIEFYIHEKCPKSIDDYVYLKEASDGTKLKEKVKNPDTQVTYEKFGHTSDSGDYFICRAFPGEFAKYQKGGTAASAPSVGRAGAGVNHY